MENISWKYLRLILGILAIWGFMISCSRDNENLPDTPDAPVIPDTGRYKIRPFNPGYFKDENQRHLAIHFRIEDGKLAINKEKDGESHSGNLPYSPGGDTVVVYKDSNGTEIGRYSIEDPSKSRSCDLIDDKRLGVFPLEKGDVELLLPTNPDIASIDIIYADKDPQTIYVHEIVKAVFDKSERNKKRVSEPKKSSHKQ